jgi:hypothetical protein
MEETTTDTTVVEPEDQVDETTEQTTEAEPETFPREYVEKLREEAAKYRTRSQRTDDLAHRLHVALVAAKGRLADPTDLTFDEANLDDDAALDAAIDNLLAAKPHLASRRPATVDVGQGPSPIESGVDLAGLLRARAV